MSCYKNIEKNVWNAMQFKYRSDAWCSCKSSSFGLVTLFGDTLSTNSSDNLRGDFRFDLEAKQLKLEEESEVLSIIDTKCGCFEIEDLIDDMVEEASIGFSSDS